MEWIGDRVGRAHMAREVIVWERSGESSVGQGCNIVGDFRLALAWVLRGV